MINRRMEEYSVKLRVIEAKDYPTKYQLSFMLNDAFRHNSVYCLT